MTVPQQFAPPAPMQFAPGRESAATAAAATAKALIEARYMVAFHRPRNWDQVRQLLLKECRRPTFAHNKSAYYKKPIGSGVEGLGIRFVEVALRCMTNVVVETTMTYEDDVKEIHTVTITDLESNVPYSQQVPISRTVERSKPMDDGSYISMRKNSRGQAVYTVPAIEDDLLNKRGAQISKAIRTLGLRLIPGDLQDEAEEVIKAIRLDKAAKDPDGERKSIVDAFAGLNVLASELSEYLGHDIGRSSPAELVDLRSLYGAIRDGEATWETAIENRRRQREEEGKGKKGNKGAEGDGGGGGEATYPQDQFDKNLADWVKSIQTGRATVARLVTMVEAKAKAKMTVEQKDKLTAEAAKPAPAAEPTVTYAQVAEKLHAAKDQQALADAASLINAVADESQRAELTELYESRLAGLAE